MTTYGTVCPRGHANQPGSAFCAVCGDQLAATCPNGHWTSPGQGFCGECGAPINTRADQGVARPYPGPDVVVGYPTEQLPSRGRRFSWTALIAPVAALIALAVGIVALTRTMADPPSAAPTGDTGVADRALCTAVAPLMTEVDRINHAYLDLGDSGTPARDGATSKYIADNQDWVKRIQPILDQNPDTDGYLRRSLQQFVDDVRLLASILEPGPLSNTEANLWAAAAGTYNGSADFCDALGVKW